MLPTQTRKEGIIGANCDSRIGILYRLRSDRRCTMDPGNSPIADTPKYKTMRRLRVAVVLTWLFLTTSGVAPMAHDPYFPAKKEPSPSPAQRFKSFSGPYHGTFFAKLENAPYPYAGKYADSEHDFFDYIDPKTGERFHTNRY
ncbi:MAG TPA: hypothetical protein DCZ69_02135, partial [Syntrophobacteraceae bacterium]|nr:hypothetical protein [Syntrophobacteraceae bacterium]